MYELAVGPLLWTSFAVFIGGSAFRLVRMHILAKKERIIYPFMTWRHSLRSISHWIVPFASRNMRLRPATTIVTFLFHISLILAPVFLIAHNVLLQQAWGFSLWMLPDPAADAMTVIVLAGCAYFFVRRLFLPEVLYVTTPPDILFLAGIAGVFITGLIARHQWLAYNGLLLAHILLGELLLALIPFTRLSHMLYFFFTRGYMGSEFGAVRGTRDW